MEELVSWKEISHSSNNLWDTLGDETEAQIVRSQGWAGPQLDQDYLDVHIPDPLSKL